MSSTAHQWNLITDEAGPPNTVFDVMAKKWDAALDTFTHHRFAGCVQVDGVILWSSPFLVEPIRLVDVDYRPTHWQHLPEAPPELLP